MGLSELGPEDSQAFQTRVRIQNTRDKGQGTRD